MHLIWSSSLVHACRTTGLTRQHGTLTFCQKWDGQRINTHAMCCGKMKAWHHSGAGNGMFQLSAWAVLKSFRAWLKHVKRSSDKRNPLLLLCTELKRSFESVISLPAQSLMGFCLIKNHGVAASYPCAIPMTASPANEPQKSCYVSHVLFRLRDGQVKYPYKPPSAEAAPYGHAKIRCCFVLVGKMVCPHVPSKRTNTKQPRSELSRNSNF